MNFNWTRVPIGIGRTQQKILAVLEDAGDMMDIDWLTHCVYHPLGFHIPEGFCDEKTNYTKSQYNNIHRAIRALEKRQLVNTEIVSYQRNGHRVNVKMVGIG